MLSFRPRNSSDCGGFAKIRGLLLQTSSAGPPSKCCPSLNGRNFRVDHHPKQLRVGDERTWMGLQGVFVADGFATNSPGQRCGRRMASHHNLLMPRLLNYQRSLKKGFLGGSRRAGKLSPGANPMPQLILGIRCICRTTRRDYIAQSVLHKEEFAMEEKLSDQLTEGVQVSAANGAPGNEKSSDDFDLESLR